MLIINQHCLLFSQYISSLGSSKVKIFKYRVKLKSQQQPTGKVFVYKIQVNPIYGILQYGDYYDFMDR